MFELLGRDHERTFLSCSIVLPSFFNVMVSFSDELADLYGAVVAAVARSSAIEVSWSLEHLVQVVAFLSRYSATLQILSREK